MNRTLEQIKEHYELEKSLANKLRNSNKNERKELYATVYDELFRKIKHHPQLTRKESVKEKLADIKKQMDFLNRFISENITFLEVGAGDCSVTLEVAKKVKKAIAIDVSEVISSNIVTPENFQLILSDGCSIPVNPGTIDIAYSNQLMEHLHEEDAYEQLVNICNALANNGCYVCITPNRINGPHDISAYFDNRAQGFHMKEYTYYELRKLFKSAGFKQIKAYSGISKFYIRIPLFLIIFYERILEKLPLGLKKKLFKFKLFRFILFIRLAGIK